MLIRYGYDIRILLLHPFVDYSAFHALKFLYEEDARPVSVIAGEYDGGCNKDGSIVYPIARWSPNIQHPF